MERPEPTEEELGLPDLDWKQAGPAFSDEDLSNATKLRDFCLAWRDKFVNGAGPAGNQKTIWINLQYKIWNSMRLMHGVEIQSELQLPANGPPRNIILQSLDSVIDWCAQQLEINSPINVPETSQTIECHVTLQQMAAMVNKSKRTLERLRGDGKLPTPAVKGGNGKADEWKWSDVRRILQNEYNRQLPEVFPADRFIRR